MASPRTTPENNLSSTRRLLDELDALMERMLSLPVNDLEDAGREEPPRPTLGATLTVIDTPEPASESTAELETMPPPLEPITETPSDFQAATSIEETAEPGPDARVVNWQTAYSAPEAPAAAPEIEPVVDAPPLVAPRAVTTIHWRKPRRTWAGWLLSPVVRLNLAFDRALARIGWVGKFLRRPTGRLVLGLLGLAMLTLAALWVFQDLASWTR